MKKRMETGLFKLFALILLFNANAGFAQTKYLKITLDEEQNEQVNFPPGTKFELTNQQGELVYDTEISKFNDRFTIEGKHKLVVYPSWKKKTDVFYIESGKIELISSKWNQKNKSHLNKREQKKGKRYDRSKYTGGLTLKKTLSRSERNPGKYNATFTFSNGVVAKYTDGEFTASKGDKPLRVVNKYFIYTDSGVIRLSFRDQSGETWWVFEKE